MSRRLAAAFRSQAARLNLYVVSTHHATTNLAHSRDLLGDIVSPLAVGRGQPFAFLRDRHLTSGRRVCRQPLGFAVHRLKLGRMKARIGQGMRKFCLIVGDARYLLAGDKLSLRETA
jgi:hypothetical protein